MRLLFILLVLFSGLINLKAISNYDNSASWPARLTVLSKLVQEDVNGEEHVIRAGSIGILQRVEGRRALVDFGRHGVHWVDAMATDFEEASDRIVSGQEIKEFPNAMIQLGNKIVQYVNRDATHMILDDIKDNAYILCFYVNEINEENALITQYLDRTFEGGVFSEHDILPIAFPGDDHWYGYFYNAFNHLPVFIPHMRLSYASVLWHEPSSTPSFVLIDANGKIVYRSETLRILESKFNPRISGHFSASKYEQVKRELERAFLAIRQ
ncbi:hypothetical protein QEH59_07670 [Coraliomargarita sp. SDUM461004]|uniref:DUF4238 domain-containing protein n=1 Tax=Thalassobacterium sedimentorum TaxID=3041258 RepID=A0ABU1AJF9_9BACT|nr:hypothetical protein [Coraliomargarita sp. SDUM461004]MDQ8194298.1 hypothetical protein [Coraliomargarita sp. SDUM461004]